MSKSIFSQNLKTARKLKGWTQQEAANNLFRSQQAYSTWEKGEAEPSQDTLLLICEVFYITDLKAFLGDPYYFKEMQAA